MLRPFLVFMIIIIMGVIITIMIQVYGGSIVNQYFDQYSRGVTVTNVGNSSTIAHSIGLTKGSVILAVSGNEIHGVEDLHNFLKLNLGKNVDILWQDKGQMINRSVTLPRIVGPNNAVLGVTIAVHPDPLLIAQKSGPLLTTLFIILKPMTWVTLIIIVASFRAFEYPLLADYIDKRRCFKEIDRVIKNNQQDLKGLAEEKEKLITEVKTKKISLSVYEMAENRIFKYIDKINRTKFDVEKNSPKLFVDSVKALIDAYNSIYPLIENPFRGYLVQVSNFSTKKHQSEVNRRRYLEDLGIIYRGPERGYLSLFLLRRRIKMIYSSILVTCHFYLNYENDVKKTRNVQEVIGILNENKKLLQVSEEQKSKKVDYVLSLIGILIGVISSSIIINYVSKYIPLLLSSILVFTIGNLDIYVLVIFIYSIGDFLLKNYLIGPKKWYEKLIMINHIESKEIHVKDHLISLQSFIVERLATIPHVNSESKLHETR